MATPIIKDPGIIQRNGILIENNSCEKLINTAAIPLDIVPIKVAVGADQRINMAIKNGTNSGATKTLIVLKVNSNKFPFTLPISKLNSTMTTPMANEIIFANLI